jgi:hypothetical protein
MKLFALSYNPRSDKFETELVVHECLIFVFLIFFKWEFTKWIKDMICKNKEIVENN